jgi:hypothetical protein
MMICGIAAIALYSFSWIMQLMDIPGKGWMRLAAIVPFLIGGGILLYDRAQKSKGQGRAPKGKTGWEDILDDGEVEDGDKS